jgi:hypothetical protein
MSSVTFAPRRLAAVLAALALASAVTGCSGDDEAPAEPKASSPGSTAADPAPVVTETTLRNVGGGFGAAQREKLKAAVNGVVDPWFDNAYLGAFPRTDYAAAFAGFSKGAAQDAAGRDLALLSNQAIGDQIESATATKRRVKLEVFARDGHAHGATAYVTLDFDTAGALAESRRVRGKLYLVNEKGTWQVFGYDVNEAVTL